MEVEQEKAELQVTWHYNFHLRLVKKKQLLFLEDFVKWNLLFFFSTLVMFKGTWSSKLTLFSLFKQRSLPSVAEECVTRGEGQGSQTKYTICLGIIVLSMRASSTFGGVARSHARAARERRRPFPPLLAASSLAGMFSSLSVIGEPSRWLKTTSIR